MRTFQKSLGRLAAGLLLLALVVLGGLMWLGRSAFDPPAQPVAVSPQPRNQLQPQSVMPITTIPTPPVAAERLAPALELSVPVQGVQGRDLEDTFTQAREAGARRHDAIDIPAPRGTHVLAASDGQIEKLFLSKPGGITIYQRLPDGATLLYYAHLEGYAPGLAEGQQVRAGQIIGTVGSTGNADPMTPHLHFAVLLSAPDKPWYAPAMPINPYPLLVAHSP